MTHRPHCTTNEPRPTNHDQRTTNHGQRTTPSLLFHLYRRTLSPVFAASGLGHCRFLPTCSEYALIAVTRHGWLRGTSLALRRLARCHPWSAGGHDAVP